MVSNSFALDRLYSSCLLSIVLNRFTIAKQLQMVQYSDGFFEEIIIFFPFKHSAAMVEPEKNGYLPKDAEGFDQM